MKTNKLILFIILASFFVSCENELEIEPKNSKDAVEILKTEAGIINILNGTYAQAAAGSGYGGRISIVSDLLAQTGKSSSEWRFRGTTGSLRNIFTKSILVDNTAVEDIYTNSYAIINSTNTVIENIDKVTDTNLQTRMIAEAKFLRSLVYFDLVRLFAKPYIAGSINNQLGVVIRSKAIYDYKADLSKERSTVEEVYALIISDLKDAYANLPDTNSYYADKYAAQAILARVYLQQGNYAEARDAANDVILNSGNELMKKYSQAFNHDTDQLEDVFAIQMTKQSGSNQLVNSYASEVNGGRGGDIVINSAYINKFETNDERGSFVYINPVNNRRLSSKYTSEFGDVPLVRLAEMYLIRAESNFREGTAVGDTYTNDINLLRNRAKATPFANPTLTDILRERELELGMEGFRIHDIKRTKGSISASLPWDSDLLVFPIPLYETNTNKLITQNPGY
ncbi:MULTISPECIES: RagB/SusD family nutrient uptake outer membrane protein [Flavobacterium]|uniref:RagB/SusD family nutrient uptake outer membrane protein n=1 Tax=Flavobacterium TaxID=237 RepID=UPI0022ABEEDB|nr:MULTISPECIES: RagB/SusD family nutrient uptake outer membrane protein [Flavobacterium]